MRATPRRARSALVLAAAVATGSLILGGCTSGSSSTDADSASSSEVPVESASPGVVAGAKHPRTRCQDNDDVTASVKLTNDMQVLPIRDFSLIEDADAATVWLKQTGAKEFDSYNAPEGSFNCLAVPYAVKGGAQPTYYYYDGGVWGDHTGWWGQQEYQDWRLNPRGYVDFSCSGPWANGWQPCADPALVGDVVARWDTRETAKNDTVLKSRPQCETRNSVVGCYLLLAETTSEDYDFGFETVAWTAPMQVTLSNTFAFKDSPVIESATGPQKLFIAWKVAGASIGSGRWAQNTSPQGMVLKVKRPLVVGGYAQVGSATTTTMSLRLVPAYFTDREGTALNCKKGSTTITCTYVKAGSNPDGILSFFSEDPFVTLNASLSLADISRTSGPPKVTAADIACKTNFATIAGEGIEVKCESEAAAGKSAYVYGAEWLARIQPKS